MNSLCKGMIATAVLSGMLLPVATAQAGGSMIFDAETPYVGFTQSSPLAPLEASGDWTTWVEDFEDGLVNTPGMSLNSGELRLPSMMTDSVDADDNVIDGSGQDGHSWFLSPEVTGDTLIITLPPPELCYYKLDLENTRIHSFSKQGWWSRIFTNEDEEKAVYEMAYRNAERQIRIAALQSGILDKTRDNAELILKPMFENISGKTVFLRFELQEEFFELE